MYVDGFLATEEGKGDEALERFNRILAEHPASPFIADAHMVRAEAEFTKDNPDYGYAFREYEAVLAQPASELHELALFKSAWTLWRMGQPEEAARRFLSVFQRSAERGENSLSRSAELDQLQTEALRNLVAVFVEDEKNTADDMYRFLRQAGGEQFAGEIVQALAEALYDQAHYERGIEAYRLLIKLNPAHQDAYRHGLRIAAAHSTLELWDELEQESCLVVGRVRGAAARRYQARCCARPGQPRGRRACGAERRTSAQQRRVALRTRAKNPATSARGHPYPVCSTTPSRSTPRRRATRPAKPSSARPRRLYSVYLSRFSQSEQAYEAYFNLGEINFHRLADASAAADAYLAAVRLKPQGPWSRDALYNALAALETAREAEFKAARARNEKPAETPTDKKLTEAMELYIKTYPDDREVPELLFRQGRLYYDYEVYDVAVRQWGLLLEKYPASSHARGAGELILDSFNKSRDYANIETWGRRLLKAPAFKSAECPGQATDAHRAVDLQAGRTARGERGTRRVRGGVSARGARVQPRTSALRKPPSTPASRRKKPGDLDLLRESATLLIERHKDRPESATGIWIAATTHQGVGLLVGGRELPRGPRPTLAQRRAPQGRRVQRRVAPHHARPAQRSRRRPAALPARVPDGRRQRRSAVPDGQGARKRGRLARRRGPVRLATRRAPKRPGGASKRSCAWRKRASSSATKRGAKDALANAMKQTKAQLSHAGRSAANTSGRKRTTSQPSASSPTTSESRSRATPTSSSSRLKAQGGPVEACEPARCSRRRNSASPSGRRPRCIRSASSTSRSPRRS